MSDAYNRDLNRAIEAIPLDRGAPIPQGQAPLTLPPGLVEEAAKMLFSFWERQAEGEGIREAFSWERLSPKHQMAWLKITRVILEMTTKVVMNDCHAYLDSSNGDMGAAFARALRRYAETMLNLTMKDPAP